MKILVALSLTLIVASGALAISPPVDRPIPAIIPAPPPPGDPGVPKTGDPGTPVVNTPEPSTLAIGGISLAVTGVYRLIRRRKSS